MHLYVTLSIWKDVIIISNALVGHIIHFIFSNSKRWRKKPLFDLICKNVILIKM